MVSGTPGLMDLLVKKMSYLNQAQTVHAQNIANANTPGYKPLDVVPFTFGQAMQQANIAMATTDARHIIPASMTNNNSVAVKAKNTGSTTKSDALDIEQESTKVAETGIDYNLITVIFHKFAGLFKMALKGS